MEVATAVMVTVDLDFGAKLPSVSDALREVERRHQPDDANGRTFAILDAFGRPTPEGKLRVSMHVSAEKPGAGSLIFKRTGEVVWSSKIVPNRDPNKQAFTGKNLSIYLDNGAGKLLTIDGSGQPGSILEAGVRELGAPVGSVWPDGAEREVTFMYSARGCPVKVMVKRVGDRTERTSDQPAMFPDDPTAVTVITQLMRW